MRFQMLQDLVFPSQNDNLGCEIGKPRDKEASYYIILNEVNQLSNLLSPNAHHNGAEGIIVILTITWISGKVEILRVSVTGKHRFSKSGEFKKVNQFLQTN